MKYRTVLAVPRSPQNKPSQTNPLLILPFCILLLYISKFFFQVTILLLKQHNLEAFFFFLFFLLILSCTCLNSLLKSYIFLLHFYNVTEIAFLHRILLKLENDMLKMSAVKDRTLEIVAIADLEQILVQTFIKKKKSI